MSATDRIPSSPLDSPVPPRRPAGGSLLAGLGLIGLAFAIAGAAPSPARERSAALAGPAPAEPAPAEPAEGADGPDFGGAEIDTSAGLHRNFGVGSDAVRHVVQSDMNGDGHLDLVVGKVGQDAVYLNDGHGNFDGPGSELTFNSADALEPDHFALGDLDGDGDLDAIGWHHGTTDRANALFVNDGSGNLSQKLSFPGGNSTVNDVAIADLNGDGALDVILARSQPGSRQNTFLLNADAGTSPPSFGAEQPFGSGGDQTRALATGDLDGDGDVDMVAANGENGIAEVTTVHINKGGDGFYSGPGTCTPQWEWGVPTVGPPNAHSGTRLWGTNLDGDYANDQEVWTASPPIDLSDAGSDPIVLRWWHYLKYYSGASIDLFSVDVSRDGGASWQTVRQLGPYGLWEEESVSLDASYAVSDFRVRFRLSSDEVDTDDGFYVDDVAVTVGGSPVFGSDFEADDGGFTSSLAAYPADGIRCLGESGRNTSAVALGDMNGDGHLDIVAGNQSRRQNPADPSSALIDGQERIYLNDGSGHFTGGSGGIATGPAVDETWRLALGDVDGDGRLDIVVGDRSGQDLVRYNDGAPTPGFAGTDPVGTATAPTEGLALADLDDDAALDIAIGLDQQQSRVYLSPGALASLGSRSSNFGEQVEMTTDLALGDVDRDGDLDVVVGNAPPDYLIDPRSFLHLNDGSGSFPGSPFGPFAPPEGEVRSVAVADLDGDGTLEVLLGYEGEQNLYLKPTFAPGPGGALIGFTQGCPATCFGSGSDATHALATGDLDRDGDLDIVAGNDGPDGVHLNNGSGGFSDGSSYSFGGGETRAAAMGDLNGDSFLDLVLGNRNGQSVAYVNDGTGRFDAPGAAMPFGAAFDTRSAALGDLDGDGILDAVLGNYLQQNVIYLGDGTGGFGGAGRTLYFGTGADATLDLALGDINEDGAIDIVVANRVEANVIYLNDRASPPGFARQRAFGQGDDLTTSLALGDLNRDGTLDIIAGNQPDFRSNPAGPPDVIRTYRKEVFLNRQRRSGRLPEQLVAVSIGRPGFTANGQGHSSAEILEEVVDVSTVVIPIRLSHPESLPVRRLELSYSTSGGGAWQPAQVYWSGNEPDNSLTTSPAGNQHFLEWDLFNSDLFGQTDDLVFRVRAYAQPDPADPGLYAYPDSSAGPRQWPYASATSYPVRIRGSLVQVFRESPAGPPAADALVYRLPEGQVEGGLPFSNAGGQPLRTDASGFLLGSGSFGIGDRLFALWPITNTEHYTLYHQSGQVTNETLEGREVFFGGNNELVVRERRPLMLFNLDVSIEWDARYDDAFMMQLKDDLRRSSEILFDVTNGQVALGPVRIYHAKQEWLAADVIIHAANNLRPAATMGGVVDDLLDDALAGGEVIEDAYVPGQIQMGPAWGRFGDPGTDLGDDWPRALAHELGHYLLFQFDNYLGNVDGRLVPNDCVGSYMTDAYIDEYSELLDQSQWSGACLDTLAEKTTGRTDWETVLNQYPWLNTDQVPLEGPARLPLDFTEIEVIDPGTALRALDTPFFSLREGLDRLFVASGAGQGYLFKKQDTPELTDDYVLALGSPVGDQMHARGAEPGDRLCVFDRQRSPVRIGCATVTEFEGTFQMVPVPDWQPQIEVSPVTTDTLAITVTQSIDGSLFAQVMPTHGLSTTFPITSTVAELLPVPGEPDTYARTVQLAYPALQAFVRVWEQGTNPPREAMTEYVLGDGWGPNRRNWGPNRRNWGPNRRNWGPNRRNWGAPVSSGDGLVSVYNIDDILGDTGTAALQSLSTLPPIPPWLRPVGKILRFESAEAFNRTIAFNYLQQEVPGSQVYEDGLRIYHSTDKGATWQELETILDTDDNLATAIMPSEDAGDGLYMLAVTIAMPLLEAGWNQVGYPVAGTRPVDEALASIADDYRLVYDNGPTATGPWRLYDQEVLAEHPDLAGLVNDLDELVFGGVYWIYSLRATQAFFGLPSLPGDALPGPAAPDSVMGFDAADSLPPATYYGWVTPSAGFTPVAGAPVVASIDGVACGQAVVQSWAGQLAYKIQVDAARADMPSCGRDGATVVFSVGSQVMAESAPWDNAQALFLPLGTLATGADLAVTQEVLPGAPKSGEPFAYLIAVENLGPLPATEVELRITRPDGSDLILAADTSQYCVPSGAQTLCHLGAIPAFGSRTVILTLSRPNPGSVSNIVEVSAFEPDPNPDNNRQELPHDVVTTAPSAPTAVRLLGFHVVTLPDGRHEITWTTGSEVDVIGFLIRSAPKPAGPFQRVTPTLIPARGRATDTTRYRYVVSDPGAAFYRLEVVALEGASELFGPVPVRAANTRAYLPSMWRP